jgi:hypothetical protein
MTVTARRNGMHPGIGTYNKQQTAKQKAICDLLAEAIDEHLPGAESKIWHAHPVWFLDGNPIVGYSKQKPGIRLMFWSGAGFDEEALDVVGAKWDYKNIVRRRGRLERLER